MSTEEAQPKALVREGLIRAAALVGLGALLLCALGILETIGQLRGSEVSVRHALSIIPLDRHLRNGIDVITSPAVPAVVVILGLGYLFSRWARAARAISVAPDGGIAIEDHHISPALLKLGAIAIVVSFVWVALTAAWPWLVPLALFGSVVLFLSTRLRRFLREGGARRPTRWPEVSIALLAGAAVFTVAFDAYVMADRLPYAEIRERTGVTGGPLIARTESLIFVSNGAGRVRELADSRALRVRIIERERPDGRSLLDILRTRDTESCCRR